MEFQELVAKNRSCRRFDEGRQIPMSVLEELAGLARLCPSAGNLQPMRYVLSSNPGMNRQIFPMLGWAAYLKDWKGPEEGERPSAYIVMVCEGKRERMADWDTGIAAQTLLLGAREKGIGGCMIGSFDARGMHRLLSLEEADTCCLVLALGYPKEFPVIETVGTEGDIRYWRDEAAVHHVPKRSMDVLIRSRYGS